ncbi:MAG: HNH endonuclease signature motif containing protein, partial [Gemmatimonadota bacterium]
HGRIARSSKARADFQRSHPCPSTGRKRGACPGYVIDHVVPLKRGGADAPANMQWQTRRAAKAKDRIE